VSVPTLLRSLLTAAGPSGYEAAPASVWREAARAFAEVSGDALGSSIARVRGTGDGPLLAVLGHIDEIGLVVTHVDDDGFLYFRGIGGWRAEVLRGQRVELLAREGAIPGVVARRYAKRPKPGEAQKPTELDELHIDIGASGREEALGLVRIGDAAVVAALARSTTGSAPTSRWRQRGWFPRRAAPRARSRPSLRYRRRWATSRALGPARSRSSRRSPSP
jgi:putative aminopeptidase FrvX